MWRWRSRWCLIRAHAVADLQAEGGHGAWGVLGIPGGKCDAGETPEQCACREVKEELGVEVRAVRKLAIIEHNYPHALVRLHPFLCEWVSGEVQLLAVDDAKWINPKEAGAFRFPEANAELVNAVMGGFERLR